MLEPSALKPIVKTENLPATRSWSNWRNKVVTGTFFTDPDLNNTKYDEVGKDFFCLVELKLCDPAIF